MLEYFNGDIKRNIPLNAKRLKLGERHLIALREGLRNGASDYGYDANKAIRNMKIVLTVSLQVMSDVVEDLVKNRFYGFSAENVMLIVNDLYPGLVYEHGEWKFDRAEDEKGLTNYNHGFNVINGNQKGIGYRYVGGRYELMGDISVFAQLRRQGVKTGIVHRINDMILLHPELAIDVQMNGVYRKMRDERQANVMVEVLNNFSGQKDSVPQKGGLWVSTKGMEEDIGFLVEGLAVKTDKVEGALSVLSNWVKAEQGYPDIPYNRLYMYFDMEALENNLNNNLGILPLSVKDDKPRKGVWSPEIPSGDVTILPGAKVVAVMRGNDELIDKQIVPMVKGYEKGKGGLIHDFKQLSNLPETLEILRYQDRAIPDGDISFPTAGISSTGDVSVEYHKDINQRIAQLKNSCSPGAARIITFELS